MTGARGTANRAPRVDLRRPAILIDSDGVAADVTVLDVSSGGFRLEVSEPPRIGELVRLRVERGAEYSARIRWALGDEAGGIFLESVDDSQWTGTLERSRPMADEDQERGDERRQGSERREDEHRQGDDGRNDDRRKDERRKGGRRGN